MTKYINRDKYEIIKEKAYQWREKAEDYKRRYEDILEENNDLITENEDLQNSIIEIPIHDNSRETELEQENTKLQEKIEKLTYKYKDIRNQLRQLEKEKDEERLLEKLTKLVTTQHHK